jgi:DNA modification methylase
MARMRAAQEPDATLDLNFTEGAHQSATHMLHPYAARCPPPLARWAISNYSNERDVVLDPMTGSGTTLVEACLLGRTAVGADIDPLARLIARVKATPVSPADIRRAADRMAALLDDDHLDDGWRPNLPEFEKWFNPEVARDLGAIRVGIKHFRSNNPRITELLWVAFSALIVARTSVANARDLVHSRHHYRPWTTNPQTRSRFLKKLEQFHRRMTAYNDLLHSAGHLDARVTVDGCDARELPLSSGTVDLVFTSPPYCSALDYTRAHMFAVAWMPEILKMTEQEYRLLGREYVGTERAAFAERTDEQPLPPRIGVAEIDRVVDELRDHPQKAWIVHRYFRDMRAVLKESFRVLRPGGHLVLVVCPSNIRKVTIATPDLLGHILSSLRTPKASPEIIALHERTIHDRRRVMPYLESAFGPRMRTEYVLVARRPSRITAARSNKVMRLVKS